MGVTKTYKQLERHFKGIANHRRVQILFLLWRESDLSLESIAERLDCNSKTISEHTQRLVRAGLVEKRYKGREVLHSLLPYGVKMIKILRDF